MNNDLTIWCSYHNKNFITEYNLQNTDIIKLFDTTNTNIEGENINNLNYLLCETVTYYYVWKNQIKSDYVGFCHYRRYFNNVDFNKLNKINSVQVLSRNDTSDNLNYINYVSQIYSWCANIYFQYNIVHPSIINYFISYLYDMYRINLYKLSNQLGGKSYISNRISFIFKWEDFNKFCEIFFGFFDYIALKENVKNWKTEEFINDLLKKYFFNNHCRIMSVYLEIIASIIIEIFFKPFISENKYHIITHYDNISELIKFKKLNVKTGIDIYNISPSIKKTFNKLLNDHFGKQLLGLYNLTTDINYLNDEIELKEKFNNIDWESSENIFKLNKFEYINVNDYRDFNDNNYIIDTFDFNESDIINDPLFKMIDKIHKNK